MLMEEFKEYQDRCPEDQFKDFCDEYMDQFICSRALFQEMLYQIYLLQCCVEGLIEDQDLNQEAI